MQPPRRLVLVRHAEAAHAGHSGGSDETRELTDAGRRTARRVGAWLASRGIVADHGLVSSAVRARQTWEELCAGAGWDLDPELSRALYSAEPESALDLLRELPAGAGAVVMVGHNPTVASLAQILDDGSGEGQEETALVTRGFPPGSLALFEYDGAWVDLAQASARLLAFRPGGD